MSPLNTASYSARMPVLFVGHGSPMNAIEDNVWSQGFRALAGLMPSPSAIIAVSAHWYVSGTLVTGSTQPETIHDFYGFPPELYEIQYPAPGDPDLAKRVVQLLGEERALLSKDWGLDHGCWSVLHHMFPAADIPVIQLSIDSRLAPADHLALGRALAPLRQEGVLLLGSGNIVHNLRHAMMSQAQGDRSTPAWAITFDDDVAHAAQEHDTDFLIRALPSETGRIAHPTPDHYLPLLYAAGAADEHDAVQFPITGFDLSSLSMRTVMFG